MQFPKDLTPLERARLKLIGHFILIFVFNAVFSVYLYLSNVGTNNAFNWQLLLISASSQGALALADGLKKYYSAQGDIPLAGLYTLAHNEIAAKTPVAPVATLNQEALHQTISDIINVQFVGLRNAVVQAVSPPAQPTQAMQALPPLVKPPVTLSAPSVVASDPIRLQNTLPSMVALNLDTSA